MRVLHDAAMLGRLLDFLTVQVSEMFRDPSYFRAIREMVAPHLRTYPSLKVWIAGCSSGEELHSFAILFREEAVRPDAVLRHRHQSSRTRDRLQRRLRYGSHQGLH